MSARTQEASLDADPSSEDDLVTETSDVHRCVPRRGDITSEELEIEQLLLPPIANSRYVPTRKLGEGGWATVWEAHDRELERSVALKFLRDTRDEHLLRFRREGRIAAAVRHENLLAIFDVDDADDGRPFLVTELLRGEDLDHRLRAQQIPLTEILSIAKQILHALDTLSKTGIVHRDVKPHNIFLHRNEDGTETAKLMDFGIAIALEESTMQPALKQRVTTTGMLVGTPHYMSPEHLMGKEPDLRSDLYSLGVTLYEAVTGRAPYDDEATAALIASILRDPVPPVRAIRPDVPEELEAVLMKSLARDPDDRFQSTGEMLAAIEAIDLDRIASELAVGRPRATLAGVGPHAVIAPPVLATREDTTAAIVTTTRMQAPPPAAGATRLSRAQLVATVAAVGLVAIGALTIERGGEKDGIETKTARAAAPAPAIEAAAPPARTEPAVPPETEAPAPAAARTPRSPTEADERGARSARETAREAFRAYARGDMRRAYSLYDRATRESPSDARAWIGLGMTARATGNRSAANRAFRRFLVLRPNAPEASNVRAMITR
jgi:hypothetical protein